MDDKHSVRTVAALACALAATGTLAQTAPKMEMSTNVPAGIAAPESVDTRLGTLEFVDGFPTDAMVEKLYDNLDFQRAVQAYLLALPPVSMTGLREGLTRWGRANVTIPTFETLMDSRSLFLMANANTPYTWMWIDLKDGPLVAEIPPGVLGMINDMWFHYVTELGLVGPDCPPHLLAVHPTERMERYMPPARFEEHFCSYCAAGLYPEFWITTVMSLACASSVVSAA